MKPIGKLQKTERNFETIPFEDADNAACVLQASSLAHYTKPGISAVWLGLEYPYPRIEASVARILGLSVPKEATGWVTYPIPDEVLLSTRLHLIREQVEWLIQRLTPWTEDIMTKRHKRKFEFKDYYDKASVLELGDKYVTLGIHGVEPKIMATHAPKYGINCGIKVGWVPYPIPEEVVLTTKMIIDKDQTKSLVAHLRAWLDTDTFRLPKATPKKA